MIGFSLLSRVQNTYSSFFFVTLKAVGRAQEAGRTISTRSGAHNAGAVEVPDGLAFSFSPPAIPGVGTSGGVTFMLEDRSGADIDFLTDNVNKFVAAARKRKELTGIASSIFRTCRRTTWKWTVRRCSGNK